MEGKIKILNRSKRVTQIDIDGIIGTPQQDDDRATTYEQFKDIIEHISDIKTSEIVVNIRSIGGNVNDALLIYDALIALEAKITTRCYGYVASAATIIAQAATKGCREISKNALYLIHNSSSLSEGNSQQMAQTVDLLEKTDLRIAEIYACAAERDTEIYRILMNENSGNGRWLNPSETIELALADKIIAASKISNTAALDVRALGLPEIPQEESRLKQHWNNIINILGVIIKDSLPSPETQKLVQSLDSEIRSYQTPTQKSIIESLQDKIVELESSSARLKAKATATLPKEDPSLRDITIEPNTLSYQRDVTNFKNL